MEPFCSTKLKPEEKVFSSNQKVINISILEHNYCSKDSNNPDIIKRRQEICNRENQWYYFKLLILFQ